jgi:hypothetical protein
MFKERFSNVAKVVPYGGGGIALHQLFCPFQIGFTQLSQPWAIMPSKEFNSFEKLVH